MGVFFDIRSSGRTMSVRSDPADASAQVSALLGILDSIPGVSGIAQLLVNATTTPYQITGTHASNIETSLKNAGYNVHHCFFKKYA
jgi:hypothetical protein